MSEKRFWDILEEKARKDWAAEQRSTPSHAVASESLSPAAAANDRLHLWLTARLQQRTFGTPTNGTDRYRAAARPFPQAEDMSKSQNTQAGQDSKPARETAEAAPSEPDFSKSNFSEKPVVQTHEPRIQPQSAEGWAAWVALTRLGAPLSEAFTRSELKSAYRKLAKTLHPDRHTSAEIEVQAQFAKKFRELSTSYQLLSRDCA